MNESHMILFFMHMLVMLSILLSSLSSATTEIKIEYNVTEASPITTTTVPVTTTTVTQGGGGGGGGGGTIPSAIYTGKPFLTYKITAPLEAYINETTTIQVVIFNPSNFTLHNVGIKVSGLPPDTYTIATPPVVQLPQSRDSTFLVNVNDSALIPAFYTIRFFMKSDEFNITDSIVIDVKDITREEAQQKETQKNIEKAEPVAKSFMFAFLIIASGAAVAIVIMLIFHLRDKCTFCGGALEKTYSGTNYNEFVCKKCGQKYVESKEAREEKHNV